MSTMSSITVRNGETFAISDLMTTNVDRFRDDVIRLLDGGGRLAALFARPDGPSGFQITAVIAFDAESSLQVLVASTGPEYASITTDCPQAHWFEREIWEPCGIVPVGHPWLKPIRFQSRAATSTDTTASARQPRACGVADFFHMDGEEVHEVAVGPVHAGVIEALSCTRVSARAQVIRGIALELERVANHIGDLGALAGDIGYLPTMSYCGRIRGDVLNMTAMLCGNRFGRGLVRPGGVTYDLTTESIEELVRRGEHAEGTPSKMATRLSHDTIPEGAGARSARALRRSSRNRQRQMHRPVRQVRPSVSHPGHPMDTTNA
ncbi:MAG TPA: NADH-quinone oxidoreductase subunit C [Thermoguttaceae bacterium]|nr:NADH-quinone oxidoreductase subunit C [Thermoguttaceae bacterium]